jgi:hypothetical protein
MLFVVRNISRSIPLAFTTWLNGAIADRIVDKEIRRCTAHQKSAVGVEIPRAKTTFAEAGRNHDVLLSAGTFKGATRPPRRRRTTWRNPPFSISQNASLTVAPEPSRETRSCCARQTAARRRSLPNPVGQSNSRQREISYGSLETAPPITPKKGSVVASPCLMKRWNAGAAT